MRWRSAISPTGCAAARPFAQAWPRHEPVLSLAERREMQELLLRRGFDIGEPTGRFGPKTRAAVRDYQASVGLDSRWLCLRHNSGAVARAMIVPAVLTMRPAIGLTISRS